MFFVLVGSVEKVGKLYAGAHRGGAKVNKTKKYFARYRRAPAYFSETFSTKPYLYLVTAIAGPSEMHANIRFVCSLLAACKHTFCMLAACCMQTYVSYARSA